MVIKIWYFVKLSAERRKKKKPCDNTWKQKKIDTSHIASVCACVCIYIALESGLEGSKWDWYYHLSISVIYFISNLLVMHCPIAYY